ncbi:hypothetical protein vseg_019458 [Gypsophila vaccaria]
MNFIYQTQGAKIITEKQLIKLNEHLNKLTRSHFYRQTLSLFQQIHSSQTLTPDHYTLSTALTSAANSHDSVFGPQLHGYALRTGLAAFSHVSNSLLSLYAKNGDLGSVKMVFGEMGSRDIYSWTTYLSAEAKLGEVECACQVLDEMPMRRVEPWNAVITGCAEGGRDWVAFELFRRMGVVGLRPDNYTFASVLKMCSGGLYGFGSQVHLLVVKSGYLGWTSVVNSLISMYFNCGGVLDACRVFEMTDEMVRNVITYNAVINGLVGIESNGEALVLFKEMLHVRLKPSELTFVSIMSSGMDVTVCCQLHAQAIKAGYESSIAVSNAAMAMYSENGQMDAVRMIFENLDGKDVVSWNTVIAGYAQNHCAKSAITDFVEMLRSGIRPDEYTLGALITNAARLELVQMFHAFVQKSGIVLITEVVNALVSAFVNHGDIISAYHIFCGMPFKNQITWNAIISGFLSNGQPSKALELFLQMRNSKTDPDIYTLTTILSICSSISALEQGKQVHAYILQRGFLRESSLGNGLITMYSKCGFFDQSCRVFDCMSVRDTVSWNAVISSFAHYGEGKKAVHCFKEMQYESGIRPDQATFTSVLSACSHAGLVWDGIQIFNSMVNEHGLEPGVDHFSCLIDLLARAGYLDETERLIENKHFDLDDITLWALFSACAAYGNVRLGRIVAGLLLQTGEKSDPAVYVMLSNIHANAGRWEDAARVRELMKKVGVIKQPGRSWFKA